ncbi:MAG: TIGR03986 family CRISPR-associated RAMP protein [Anaerolineales bacterium]|nr:TIGR03986 family CRISPR-associated RAMP protein [Anaerolineales bacterium]
MWPKHDNPQIKRRARSGEEFGSTAPYNFVPLPETVRLVAQPIPGHDTFREGHTGYFDCTLTTLTPLYTRTALDPEFFEKWGDTIREMMRNSEARSTYAQFFHVENIEKPVIPGSTVRGMVRSLIEIAGAGKMVWVSDEKLFYRTVDNSTIGKEYGGRMTGNVKGGLLRNHDDHYFIEECTVLRVRRDLLGDYQELYDGRAPNRHPKWTNSVGKPYQYAPVWVKVAANGWAVDEIKFSKTTGYQSGRLVITGDIPKKQKEFVFLDPVRGASSIVVPEELIHQLQSEHQITNWQEHAFPVEKPLPDSRPRSGMLRRDDFLGKEGDPIFYLVEKGNLVFLGRAQMFRLPYNHSPLDMVPRPLRNHLNKEGQEVFDLAEAIFGYVPEKGANGERKSSRAGRVYFCDACLDKTTNGLWLGSNPTTPNILGSPKPTAFQHYLVQSRQHSHDPDIKDRLAHYGMAPVSETVARGHKLYWHKRSAEGAEADFKESDSVNWENDTQHTQIRPVKEGVTFKFRVYFENLRDFELGALWWALALPSASDLKYRHKLGMGKALGLGSVEITTQLFLTKRSIVSSIEDTPTDPEELGRYQQLFVGNDWHRAEEKMSQTDCKTYLEAFTEFAVGSRNLDVFMTDTRIQLLLTMLKWPGPDAEFTRTLSLEKFKERPVLPTPDHITAPLQPYAGGDQRHGANRPQTNQPRRDGDRAPSRDRRDQQPARTQQSLSLERRKPLDTPSAKSIEPGTQGRQLEADLKARFANEQTTDQSSTPANLTPTPSSEAAPVISDPTSVNAVEEGMRVRATVTEVRSDAIRFEIGSAKLSGTLLESRVIPPTAGQEELNERFPAGNVLDLWVLKVNKKGNIQLTMQKP